MTLTETPASNQKGSIALSSRANHLKEKEKRKMKIVNGRKFLEDSDKVIVWKQMTSSKYGLNKYLGEPCARFETCQEMTNGEYKERKARGEFPEEDEVGFYSYTITLAK